MPKQIKQEPVSESEDESLPSVHSTKTDISESSAKSTASTVKPSTSEHAKKANMSGESLYEDAVSEPPPKNVFDSYVRIDV